ncbi:Fc receptor-like protein [Sarotherodon galilaeus]
MLRKTRPLQSTWAGSFEDQLRSRLRFGAFQRLNMCSSLSNSRLILLISLSVMMLISVSGAKHLGISCYKRHSNSGARKDVKPNWEKNIISCFEENRERCLYGFEVQTSSGRTFFLRPDTEWLKRKINEGTLLCPPVISK